MPESIVLKLRTLSCVMQWLGKFEEARCLDALAMRIQHEGIDDYRDVLTFLEIKGEPK